MKAASFSFTFLLFFLIIWEDTVQARVVRVWVLGFSALKTWQHPRLNCPWRENTIQAAGPASESSGKAKVSLRTYFKASRHTPAKRTAAPLPPAIELRSFNAAHAAGPRSGPAAGRGLRSTLPPPPPGRSGRLSWGVAASGGRSRGGVAEARRLPAFAASGGRGLPAARCGAQAAPCRSAWGCRASPAGGSRGEARCGAERSGPAAHVNAPSGGSGASVRWPSGQLCGLISFSSVSLFLLNASRGFFERPLKF